MFVIPYLQIIQHLRKAWKCYVSKGIFLTNAEMFFLASFKDFEFLIASDEMFHSLVDGYLYILIISHHSARQGSEQTVTFVVRLLDPGTCHQLELLTAWVVKWTKLYIYLKLSL